MAQGDASRIAADASSYDAVFDLGIIHHVPDWQEAVNEVARVLRPRGRFFFEEVTRHALERWTYRRFLDHPIDDRFSGTEFVAELERSGFEVPRWTQRFFGDFAFGVGFRNAQPGGSAACAHA